MLAYIAGLVGVGLGIRTAWRRHGNRADMAQYAVGFGLTFFLLAYLALAILAALV